MKHSGRLQLIVGCLICDKVSAPNQQDSRRKIYMEARKITKKEQSCISNCIFEHWGDPDSRIDPEQRDKEYERCLSGCRICGNV